MGESDMSVSALISAIEEELPHTFTPLHLQLAHQALRTKCYLQAIPILDSDIYQIISEPSTKTDGSSPPTSLSSLALVHTHRLVYQDVVTYFLYGGMIYLAVGKYDRAIQFFELATIYPTNTVPSMIQIEAYKKWILVNLVHRGMVPPLSRTLVGQHARILNVLAKPYETIAQDFKVPDHQRLANTVDAGRTIWKQDHNVGLISLVLRAHQRFAISSLSKIYQSISISKVHNLAFLPSTTYNEVYEYTSNLITSGQLSATLTPPESDSSRAFLRFVLPVAEGAEIEKERVQLALKQQAKIEVLNEYVKDMKHTLQLTKPYLESLHKNRKKVAKGDGQKNGSNNSGLQGYQHGLDDGDEDLETL